MPVRDLKKLKPAILEALLLTTEDIEKLERMTDEEILDIYCGRPGLMADLQSIKESKIQPMWCYHMVPIGDSLLGALNSIPYEGQFVTVQDGQVVYRCET